MAGSDSPYLFPLGEMMAQGVEQTRKAMENYFDFFQKNVKASPLLETDLTEKMKTFTEQNIAAASEFAQKASKAKDFQDFWRIQTEFMQAQWKAFAEQTKELTEAATKMCDECDEGFLELGFSKITKSGVITWLVTRIRALDDMNRFYEPDLTSNPDSPFIRDGNGKLVRCSYWMDMDDRTFVMVMTKGIGANLTNDEKRAHLADLRREHLIDQVCVQEILPPEK